MATLEDVAREAGVSKTTVSRFLNNSIELPPATVARIEAAVSKHDYRPNVLARRLSTGKTEAIGLIIPEIREPFFAELASVVEDEADRHGYTIFISSTRSDRAREVVSLNRLGDHHVDGVILLTNTPDEDGSFAQLISQRKNVVLLDEDVPGVDVPKVFVENEAGAYRATRYLIDNGHRRIAFLGGPQALFSSEERFAGFARAMLESDLPLRPFYLRRGSFMPEFARRHTIDLLRLPEPPTAIFATSDYLTLGALQALREAAVAVPADVSLISFDDTPLGAMLSPPLTAIRQPIEALGRHGFQTLFSLMTGGSAPALTRLPVDLVERNSVAQPS